ncbi:MAG: hypothetical protein UZ22_OP11002000253 [Microgenomates bacterium OLB23]|nr:MAG: hypothetical protein UZ22_OP11002000253 [Microgenomates bacterium OLB23]
MGFKGKGWKWPLERAYHHLFSNDDDIITFAKETGFTDIYFTEPHTDSLYFKDGAYTSYPVDSPVDFLRLPLLSPVDKIRGVIGLGILKVLPFFSFYETISAEQFVRKYMGNKMWEVFFEQLFRKKYGKYAGNILASFLWARIHKRTKDLGYIRNGFQSFIEHIEKIDVKLGVRVKKNYEITNLEQKNGSFLIDGSRFDVVVSTLPSPILAKVAGNVLPKDYLNKIQNLHYLHARVLIIETDQALLDGTYWLNVCTDKVPLMLVAQHTNFVDKKYYNGNHIAYVGYYLEREDKIMRMSESEFKKEVLSGLNKFITKNFKVINTYDFIGPFAQPIFDASFVKNKPNFTTPVPHFYIANLDMTYPYDRGTNYAVQLGRKVSALINR